MTDNSNSQSDNNNHPENNGAPPPGSLPPPVEDDNADDDYFVPPAQEPEAEWSVPPPPPNFTRPAWSSQPRSVASTVYPVSTPALTAEDQCTIIGATASGKTTLLFAIERACNLPGADQMDLRFMAEPGSETANLLRKPISLITKDKETMEATIKTEDYPFRIYVKAPSKYFWERSIEESLYINVKDGSGGAIFPEKGERDSQLEEQWQELIPHSGVAKAIILCIDATNPRLDLIEAYLPDFIARISRIEDVESDQGPMPARVMGQIMDQLGRRQMKQSVMPRRVLRVNRFLLLLTQIDKLCGASSDPQRFAQMLAPVEQAYSLLGPTPLNRIFNSLRPPSALYPPAKFAVGVVSAWGFDPETGEPLANDFGKARALGDEPVEYILRRWTPFGIRDALSFIATGRAEGTVRMVTPEAVQARQGHKDFEVYIKQ